jgi:DNA-binding GntR family transcriptional regulator
MFSLYLSSGISWLVSYGDGVRVDHFDATPLYLQLEAILRHAIESGELPPRQPVPSESYLMGEHGVSRGTVRHALQILRDDGLVQTFPGRGTFVAGRE